MLGVICLNPCSTLCENSMLMYTCGKYWYRRQGLITDRSTQGAKIKLGKGEAPVSLIFAPWIDLSQPSIASTLLLPNAY